MKFNLDSLTGKIKEKSLQLENHNDISVFSTDKVRSAVLVPITMQQDKLVLLYTRRAAHLPRHRGQVSFPGGVIEKIDRSPLDAALRETCEEIGISREQIEVIGKLNPFDSTTGYFIYPFIGIIKDLNGLHKDDVEVDRIFCIPIDWLCEPKHSELRDFEGINGTKQKIWFFDDFDGESLWGISAKITRNLIDLIKNNER